MKVSFRNRMRFSPFLAQLVVIRRCNLSCGYCNEFDSNSSPVDAKLLQERLEKLKELGTFGICLTGGEPTLHPDLPELVAHCRKLKFFRTGMISNGLLLTPKLIQRLNEAGLQELQISIDGVKQNSTTSKVLDNLRKRLRELKENAKFKVTISGVVGACPPEETFEVIQYAKELKFTPRVLLVHDHDGQVKLSPEQLAAYYNLKKTLPKTWKDFSDYRDRLIKEGTAPFKCRAGSRYLYVDEFGNIPWCSQTRDGWSKPLLEYRFEDLKEQFYTYKSCQDHCTLGCVRSSSSLDNWRYQNPNKVPEVGLEPTRAMPTRF